jgi:nucleotide sugar dehydrogenase
MQLSVIGGGHVGLVSAACFADRGYQVILTDQDSERVRVINQAVPPFYETGLEDMLKRSIGSGRLRATRDSEDAVSRSDVTFIAVGTPSRADGSIDLTHVKDSCAKTGRALKKKKGYHLIVLRSTVVPGTTSNLVKPTLEKNSRKKAGRDFGLAMQPEFLREGSAIEDTINPDRIIIGEYDPRSGETLLNLYREFYGKRLPPTLRTNLASAEMTKYASNAFLATKISFMNEVANICEKVPGVDVVKVAEGMGLDKRIGKRFLQAGAGFGGSCFAKDVNAIIAFAKSHHYKPRILESVLRVNKDQATHVVELAEDKLGTVSKKRIAVLGLSFKPGTDDVREAPSLKIIKQLLRDGADVVACDPLALVKTREMLGSKIAFADSARSCLQNAHAALIVTEWEEFKELCPADFRKRMRKPIVVDARRIYDPAAYRLDTTYVAVGLRL